MNDDELTALAKGLTKLRDELLTVNSYRVVDKEPFTYWRNPEGPEAWREIEALIARVAKVEAALDKSRAAFEALLRETDPEIAAEHAAAIEAMQS